MILVVQAWQLQDHLSSFGALKPPYHLSHGTARINPDKKEKNTRMTIQKFETKQYVLLSPF